MARIPQDTIDRIRDTANIVDVVSQHVDLTKRGRNFFGLCPFHNEKTPSFSVAPEKGIYHCFGCGKGGSALNFIMEIEKISFVEAVTQLGKQLGIEIEFCFQENPDGLAGFRRRRAVHVRQECPALSATLGYLRQSAGEFAGRQSHHRTAALRDAREPAWAGLSARSGRRRRAYPRIRSRRLPANTPFGTPYSRTI